jgi:hypothetical protein
MPFMAVDPTGMAWKDIRDTFQQSMFPEIEWAWNLHMYGNYSRVLGWMAALAEKARAAHKDWKQDYQNRMKGTLNYGPGDAVTITEVGRTLDHDLWEHFDPLAEHRALIFGFNEPDEEKNMAILYEAGKDDGTRRVDAKTTPFPSVEAAMIHMSERTGESIKFKEIKKWQPRPGITREKVNDIAKNWKYDGQRYFNFNITPFKVFGADCWTFVRYGLRKTALWWWWPE